MCLWLGANILLEYKLDEASEWSREWFTFIIPTSLVRSPGKAFLPIIRRRKLQKQLDKIIFVHNYSRLVKLCLPLIAEEKTHFAIFEDVALSGAVE